MAFVNLWFYQDHKILGATNDRINFLFLIALVAVQQLIVASSFFSFGW
jgi:hypothetical protein